MLDPYKLVLTTVPISSYILVRIYFKSQIWLRKMFP
jgi:hypothetical protein